MPRDSLASSVNIDELIGTRHSNIFTSTSRNLHSSHINLLALPNPFATTNTVTTTNILQLWNTCSSLLLKGDDSPTNFIQDDDQGPTSITLAKRPNGAHIYKYCATLGGSPPVRIPSSSCVPFTISSILNSTSPS